MSNNLKKFKKIVIFLLFPFLLFGCNLKQKLELFDKKIGDSYSEFKDKQEDDLLNIFNKSKDKSFELSEDLMEKIDKWIEDNNLNSYGDAIDHVYEKGAPLINELDQKVDRYYYILKNHPNLLDKLN